MIKDGDYIIVERDKMGISSLPNGCGIRVVNGEIVDGEHGAGAIILYVTQEHLESGYVKPMETMKMIKTVKEMARDELVKKMKDRMGTATVPVTDEFNELFKPPEPVVKAKPEQPDDTYQLFSDLYGFEPTDGPDFWCKTYPRTDWTEDDQLFIPSLEKFKHFVIDRKVLSREVRALECGLKVLVVGPPGSGKTTSQEFICAKAGQPYLRINGRGDMESDELLGKPWVKGGAMTFELAEFPKAFAAGWFITIDEPWKLPSSIHMTLQRPYEKDGILQLDGMPGTLAEKQIKPMPSTKLVLCDNVVGTGDGASKYGATMIQDGSTLNRIDVVIKMDYLSHSQEVEMLEKMHPDLTSAAAEKMIRFASLIRTGYEQDELSAALSPRNLDAWGRLTVAMDSVRAAFESTILERYAEESERSAVEEHYRNVFG